MAETLSYSPLEYQDVWQDGRAVKRGQRDCEGRWELLRPILAARKRGFTLCDLGANRGYFSQRAHEEFAARATMIESEEILPSLASCRAIHQKITAAELAELGREQRFDVVLALSVLHHFPAGEAAAVVKAVMALGAKVIVEYPLPIEDDHADPEVIRQQYEHLEALGGRLLGMTDSINGPRRSRKMVLFEGGPAIAAKPRPPCLCTGRADIRCDREHCDLAHPAGAPGDARKCVPCWQYHYSSAHNLLWGGDGKVKSPPLVALPKLRRQQTGLPCVHLGTATGEERLCPTCKGETQLKLFSCSIHGQCTAGRRLADGTACCDGCPDRKEPIEWISTARLAQDTLELLPRLPPDISGVAGVPRSGMIPAAILATHLHLPLFEVSPQAGLRQLGYGSRAPVGAPGPLLVVDDTIYDGSAMTRARHSLRGRAALFAVVYATPWMARSVDLHVRQLGSVHLLEWNLVNNGVWGGNALDPIFGSGVATDFDGILCHNETGLPRWLPRKYLTRLIVTGRPESMRRQTEAWLRKWRVQWERLVMFPGDKFASWEEIAAYKAEHYLASACGFFLESEPCQAQRIHDLTGKPVICPDAAKVWH